MNTQCDAARFDPHTALAERFSEQAEEGVANWMSTNQAALLLGVSSRGVQRRCQAATLRARRSQGGRGEICL